MSISAGTATIENSKEAPQTIKNRATIWPSNPASGYLKDSKVFMQKDICTTIFTAVLFTVAKTWRQPKCLLKDDLIEKMWFIYTSDFQPFPSHGTHKLIMKILWHTKKVFFANLTNNRYDFDSYTGQLLLHWLSSFFFWTVSGKRGQCPWLNSQVPHVLKCFAAHQLKIVDINNGIVLSLEKRWNIVICNTMDGSWEYHVKQNKSDSWFLKRNEGAGKKYSKSWKARTSIQDYSIQQSYHLEWKGR